MLPLRTKVNLASHQATVTPRVKESFAESEAVANCAARGERERETRSEEGNRGRRDHERGQSRGIWYSLQMWGVISGGADESECVVVAGRLRRIDCERCESAKGGY